MSLPLYESFIRGEEEEEDEEDEEEDEDEERVTVLEEAYAAATPSTNRELQVTIIIITMVIILAAFRLTSLFQKLEFSGFGHFKSSIFVLKDDLFIWSSSGSISLSHTFFFLIWDTVSSASSWHLFWTPLLNSFKKIYLLVLL